MRKEVIILLLFATMLGLWTYNCRGSAYQPSKLNWVEVSKGKLATQVMFDFSKPFYFEKNISKDQLKLELSFPGMDFQDFQRCGIIPKLKVIPLVKNVSIEKKDKPISKVVITIFFENTGGKKGANIANSGFVIKWSKMDDPNRLILDIFRKDRLDYLKNEKSIILQAKNELPNEMVLKKK